jgi:redox-sensing transcriptional repressor
VQFDNNDLMAQEKIMAAPSVRRLPAYLDICRAFLEAGQPYISSTFIAKELDIEPVQVRKDLAITGILGRPQKGYAVESLIGAIERFLGWDAARDAVLVGAGNLGSALLGHREFDAHGLHLCAAFDNDRQKIGTKVHSITGMDAGLIDQEIPRLGVKLAVLTVPADQAAVTTAALVNAGITGIWNFTGVKLPVPANITVQNEDLASGFAMLCIKMQNKKSDI